MNGAYAFEGVDAGLLNEVHQTCSSFLFGALGQNPRWSQSLVIANDLPVTGNVAKAKMASRAYGVHEWVDERHKAKISHVDHEIVVKRWANAISLKIDDLEDESLNLGQYKMLISEMGDDFDEHKHSLFIDLITNGFAGSIGTAYDGQYFFDTDHPLPDATTQSNTDTAVFADTALYLAIKKMSKMKKPNGMIAGITPTHGIFPEALRVTVEATLNKNVVANGSDNPLYKRITPIFDARLDAVSETAWYVIDASKQLKPFFMANRKAVTPQMSNTAEFEEGTVSWGAYGRYNASYGFYQTMFGSTGAG